MNVLIDGYGSIGSRHAKILGDLGCRVSVFSRRKIDFPIYFLDLSKALSVEKPDYVVIANETAKHDQVLSELADLHFAGLVLVEKPLFHTLKPIPDNQFRNIFVGYNLRFHPLLQRLKELLANEKPVAAHIYAGQDLATWRPSADYRTGYSAQKSLGGGVLRDLSHELDYVNWLFGTWETLTANGGHLSQLEIDSDDVYNIFVKTSKCPSVTIQLNYIDRTARREILIHTQNCTIEADLRQGTLNIDGKRENYQVERETTYRTEHQAVFKEDTTFLCTAEQGMEVVEMIDAVEQASQQKIWLPNSKLAFTAYH